MLYKVIICFVTIIYDFAKIYICNLCQIIISLKKVAFKTEYLCKWMIEYFNKTAFKNNCYYKLLENLRNALHF